MKYFKKISSVIIGLIFLATMLPMVAFGAFTDGVWVNLGTYAKPNISGGLNLLISGSNKYLNWGSTVGTSGYGIRDNAGSMEFKDSGGAWAGFGTGGSSSPLTTKGDLYTYSTLDARLAVGTNGKILSANSATATGLEWINAPSTITLQVNGTPNTDQTLLNLIQGTGISIADNGAGGITIANTAMSQWTTTGSNIYYSTGNVGIGTDATNPTELLFVRKDQDNSTNAHFKNLSTGTSAQTQLGVFSDTGGAFFQVLGSNYSYQNSFYGGSSALQSINRLIFTTDSNVANGGSSSMDFMTGGYDSTTQKRMTIASGGQVSIGNTTTSSKFNVYSATGAIQRLETGTSTLDLDFISTVGQGAIGINSDAIYIQALDSLSNGIYFWMNTAGSNSLHLLANGSIQHTYNSTNYLSTSISSIGSTAFDITSSSGSPTFTFNKPITVSGAVSSTVTNSIASFTAYASSAGYPAAQFNIGDSSSDNNVQFYISPTFTSASVYKTAVLGLTNNKDVLESGSYQGYLSIGDSSSGLFTISSNRAGGTQPSGLPINFMIGSTEILRMDTSNNVGIGTGATVSARLHAISTTEQLRLGYDAADYFSTTIDSNANTTFNLIGTTPKFTFSDPVIFDNVARLKGYTVSGLPSCTQGDTAFVTDALAPTFLVTAVGGGAVVSPVFCDATNSWVTY